MLATTGNSEQNQQAERDRVIGRAPGKVILLGEHAVVYGRPAIAVPVHQVQAEAEIRPGRRQQGIVIEAVDLGRTFELYSAPPDDPLRAIITLTLEHLKVGSQADITITVHSTVPLGRGMGSGAAVSAAIVRALSSYFERWLPNRVVSDLVFEVEKLHHGTPSGIDNSVVAFEKPVYFVKDQTLDICWVKVPFWLVVADTGIISSTREVVGDVRQAWQANPARYEALFDEIGILARLGRQALEVGELTEMGRLMNENHRLLQALDVSCPELDGLVHAARQGGALGAKLSGAGRGGNMIALVTEESCGNVGMFLRLTGARQVIVTQVR